MSKEEIQAEDLVKLGEIDQALAIYQQLKPDSSRILNIIGDLYAEKKDDFERAIDYYKKALKIQEENSEDISDTLTKLGFSCQNRHEYDLALVYHCRALSIRQLADNINQQLIANNLYGIANAYWGLQNLSEALNYANQSLVINQSIQYRDDSYIAANLATLANIYYNYGDNLRALELAKQALVLLERCVPSDSSTLAPVLNNIGTIQFAAGLYKDALLTFIRLLHIWEKTLPKNHSKRIELENLIERLTEMQQNNLINSCNNFSKFLSKIFLV